MGRKWLIRVIGSGADSLAKVKGKGFPAPVRVFGSAKTRLLEVFLEGSVS